jgi:steroid 5-alpha reductase family enzyme
VPAEPGGDPGYAARHGSLALARRLMGRAFVPTSRGAAFLWIAVGYLVALAAGIAVVQAWPGAPSATWQRVAVADVAATVVIFVFSVLFDNSSFYDAYWSVAPIPIAAWLAGSGAAAGGWTPRRVVVVALVAAWGVRLTWNWARGWSGFGHEDWRYVDYRKKTGSAYWLVSFAGLHFMPTVTVFLGMLALWPALTSTAPLGALDAAAALVTVAAIVIEATADAQLRAFRLQAGHAPGQIMHVGLWARCRHPNYLGEISFWWGVYLFGLAGDLHAWWWTLVGPVWITAMLVTISIPLIDRRSLARRPGYAEHIRRVPALLPRLGRPPT